jgi:hypothetical protein
MISSKNLEITGSRHLINWLQTQQISLATLSERHSFKSLWQPPFISKLVAEDRCHLNVLKPMKL